LTEGVLRARVALCGREPKEPHGLR
jgi:hypothetical protein